MLLGLSSLVGEVEVDVSALVGEPVDIGIAHSRELLAFVDSICADDTTAIALARDSLLRVCDHDTVVDAAAVCANFQMMNRIADATGTPLDSFSVEPSRELRATLGIDCFDGNRLP